MFTVICLFFVIEKFSYKPRVRKLFRPNILFVRVTIEHMARVRIYFSVNFLVWNLCKRNKSKLRYFACFKFSDTHHVSEN